MAGTRSPGGLTVGSGLVLLTAVLLVALSQAAPDASADGAAGSGSAETAQAEPEPTGLSADVATNGTVTLTWEDGPNEGYTIFRDGSDIGDATFDATQFIDDEPPPDGPHTYEVEADGLTAPPASVDVTVATPRLPPQDLTATATGDTVMLDWDGPDQGFVGGFRVYRDGTRIATTTASEHVDTGLAPGTYDYQVTTVHQLDDSVESTPAGPVQATVAGGALNVTAAADGDTVTVSWDDVCAPGDFGDPYQVARDGTQLTTTTGTSFQETLAEGTYTYTVTDLCTERTDSATVTVDLAPPAPEGLTAAVDGDTVTLTWDAVAEADGYGVHRDGTRIATASDTTHQDPGLADGPYDYRVTALEGDLESPPSAPAEALVATPPPGPQNLAASVNGDTVTLTWDPPGDTANVGGYRVYRDGSSIGRTTGTQLQDPGLDEGAYDYTVTAVHELDDAVESAPAGPARADVLIPPAPPELTATVDGDTVTLTWESPPGIGGHRIYRDGVQLAERPGTARTHVDRGVPEGTHIYRVSVTHRLDPSIEVPSNPARVEIEAPPPPDPDDGEPPAPDDDPPEPDGDPPEPTTPSPDPAPPPAAVPGPAIDPTPLTDPQQPPSQSADGQPDDGDGDDGPVDGGGDGDAGVGADDAADDADGDGGTDGDDDGDPGQDGDTEPAELDLGGPAVSSGAQVDVSGAFCAAADDVAVTIDGTQVATTTAGGDGAFRVTVDAPAGAGRHDVTVSCGDTTATSPLDVVVTTGVGGGATSTVGTVLAFFVLIGLVLWPRAVR